MHFSFQSSLSGVPFDTTDNALTIFRCSSALQYVSVINNSNNMHGIDVHRCAECLETGSVCGWCEISSICSGLPQDCINTAYFMQVKELAFAEVLSML